MYWWFVSSVAVCVLFVFAMGCGFVAWCLFFGCVLGMTCGLYVLWGLGFAAVWFVWGSSISLWFLVCFPDWVFGGLFLIVC